MLKLLKLYNLGGAIFFKKFPGETPHPTPLLGGRVSPTGPPIDISKCSPAPLRQLILDRHSKVTELD